MKSAAGLILLYISTAGFAQTEKRSFMVGGTLGFSSTSASSVTTTSLNLSPNISYFFFDRFAAGIVTPYSTAKGSNSGGTFAKAWTYSIGPTVRYYFLKGPLGFFPEVSYSWGWSHGKSFAQASGLPEFDTNGSSTLLDISGGVTYFISKNVGVEGIFSYQETHRKIEYISPPGGPTVIGGGNSSSTGLNFQIGLQVYLVPRNP